MASLNEMKTNSGAATVFIFVTTQCKLPQNPELPIASTSATSKDETVTYENKKCRNSLITSHATRVSSSPSP